MSDHPPTPPSDPPSGARIPWGTAPGVPGASQPAVPGQAPPPAIPQASQWQPTDPGQTSAGPPHPPTPPLPPGPPLPTVAPPDVPLHPTTTGGPGSTDGGGGGGAHVGGPPPATRIDGHQQPHAASAGPQDGARGAMWFAALVALVVVVCLVGAIVVALRSL